MKTISGISLIAMVGLAAVAVAEDAPKVLTDADLLALAKDRAKLEKVLPTTTRMDPKVAVLCASAAAARAPDPGPHGKKWNWVYTNSPEATDALWDPMGKFPVGSVLLKEKCSDNAGKHAELFTGMLKREKGFDAAKGDWEYFVIDGQAAKLEERGKIQSCIECHSAHAAGDYATREYLNFPTTFLVREGKVNKPNQPPGPPMAQVIPASSENVVRLHSRYATVIGSQLQYEPKPEKNTLGFWTKQEDYAVWAFSVAAPGGYEVEMLQGCGKGSGGAEVEVKCSGQTLSFVVEDTGHFQNFKQRKIGKFTLNKAGEFLLEVKPKTKPGVAVMDLRRVVLRKVAE